MNPRRLDAVAPVLESGADDRVFDTLLLSGPLVAVLLAALGRSSVTVALAGCYVAFFTLYLLYKGVRHDRQEA